MILVFAVFLHHVGMPFNGDDWVIMNKESSKALDDFMVYFEQFRLPTLFMIAGVGAHLLLSKIRPKLFVWDKIKRLFIPLCIGVLLIIPPQNYFKDPAQYDSLFQAFPILMLKLDYMHLWFIEYLFVFSMLAVPLHFGLQSDRGQRLVSGLACLTQQWWGLLSLAIVLAALRTGLKIPFPSDSKGIENLSSSLFYFFFFVMGMLLSQRPEIWSRLGQRWNLHTAAFVMFSVVFYVYYFVDFSAYASSQTLWSIWWAVCSILAWIAALCFMGLAQKFLSTTPAWLVKANKLIYPFYILHQTVIVICAYYIVQWPTSISVKLIALLILSFGITSLLCVLVIAPFNFMRFLFGLKPKIVG